MGALPPRRARRGGRDEGTAPRSRFCTSYTAYIYIYTFYHVRSPTSSYDTVMQDTGNRVGGESQSEHPPARQRHLVRVRVDLGGGVWGWGVRVQGVRVGRSPARSRHAFRDARTTIGQMGMQDLFSRRWRNRTTRPLDRMSDWRVGGCGVASQTTRACRRRARRVLPPRSTPCLKACARPPWPWSPSWLPCP